MPNTPFSADAVNLLGGVTDEVGMEYENRVKQEEGFGPLLERAFEVNNAAKALWDTAERTLKYEADAAFNIEDEWDEITKDVPSTFHAKLARANSRAEADAIREGIQRDMQNRAVLADNGWTGVAANLAAGLIDVDMLLPALKSAKLANMSIKARMAHSAVAGAKAALVTESGLALAGDTNTWAEVPTAVLASTFMGAALGRVDFSKTTLGLSVKDVSGAEEGLAKFDAAPDSFLSSANDFAGNTVDPDFLRALDGLSDVIDRHTGADVFAGDAGSITERASKLSAAVKMDTKYTTGWLGKFSALIDRSPLTSDTWGRLFNSDSPTAKALAVSLMENSTGAVINNKSAAMVKEHVFNNSYKKFSEGWDDIVRAGRKNQGISILDMKGIAAHEHELSQQVIMAANDLRLGKKITAYPKDVQDALAHIKEFSEYMRTEARGGHGGARAVPGFENVKAQEAYIPLHWSGEKVRGAVVKNGRDAVVGAVHKAYAAANPDLSSEALDTVAKALVRRAETKGTTIDNNLNSLLAGDGKDFLKQALVDNGLDASNADNLINRLLSKDTDKGKIAYARRRTDIDIAGTYDGMRIVDLIDTDLNKIMFQYSDSMSKRIALSRHGIDSAGQVEYIKNTVMQELSASTKSANELNSYRDFLDHAFSHFEPGSLDRNVNPWVRRAKQATNLSLLSKLGLTQAVETGATLAQVGVKGFIASSPVLKRFVKDGMNTKQVQEELGWMVGNLGYERGLLRSDMVADMALDATGKCTDLARRVDDMLAKGQAVQSVVSGYTAVMEAQINTAALSVTNKIFRGIRDGKVAEMTPMLRSMGVSTKQLQGLDKLVKSGAIKFNEHGHVDSLSMDKWGLGLREQYGMSVQRFVRQVIQRPMAGESIPWMHETAGAMISHLQTFPLLAMRKQFVRNVARTDKAFEMLTMYGLGTATIGAIVGNAIEGKEQTVAGIARRSFSLSNSIGWTTLGVDPAMAILGLGDYSPGGRYSGTFSLPMLDTLTQAVQVPSAVGSLVTGNFSKTDKRAMQVVPVVGSMYGMGRVFNALIDEDDAE